MRAQRGFSVIELLIAIAIILVIAAIAVPGLLRSHVAANEATAIASMHRIDRAQVVYSATYNVGFATTLAELGPPPEGAGAGRTGAGLLQDDLGCKAQPCTTDGYAFAIQHTESKPTPIYHAIALPLHPGFSGGRGFCADQSHRVLSDPDGRVNCREQAE